MSWREEVFLELTRSICPVCREVIDAELNARAGKVFLRKRCDEHGEFEALVYGDADRYLEIQRYNKPGTLPLAFQTEVADGCPSDCGICPAHKQHSCLGIIEVNTACNLDCPICFAESGTGPQHNGDGGFSLTLEQVEGMLDAFLAAEGEPEAVQFSGGEPSIHREIVPMLAAARERGIKLVMLNTNGIRLARDRRFAPALAALGVHVYLQFDGFKDSTHRAIRGRLLQREKQRALDACAAAGVGVSLAAAVELGVNDDELGAIVRFGVEHPAVNSVFFRSPTPGATSTSTRSSGSPTSRSSTASPRSCPSGSARTTSSPCPAARRRVAPPRTRSTTAMTWCRCRASSISTTTSTT